MLGEIVSTFNTFVVVYTESDNNSKYGSAKAETLSGIETKVTIEAFLTL